MWTSDLLENLVLNGFFYLFYLFMGLCSWIESVFLFKTYLDLSSYDF